MIGEELLRVKAATNGTLDKDKHHLFWSKWTTDDYVLLVNQLGFKTQASRFLHGAFLHLPFCRKLPFRRKLYPSCKLCSWLMRAT